MKPGADRSEFRLAIPSQTRYLNLVTAVAKRGALAAGFDDSTAAKISIAMDEAVTNVILHAYHGEPGHELDIELAETAAHAGITRFRRAATVGCHPAFITLLADLVTSALSRGGEVRNVA